MREEGNPAGGGAVHQRMFGLLHGSHLVYNATWEDPRIDRALLGIGSESEVVAITSAGCNVLDMLLDGPRTIDSVDINPRQNFLLELKLALIRAGNFEHLFQFFGIGSHPGRREVFRGLRGLMSAEAERFWNGRQSLFSPRGPRSSFYWHGTAGTAAWAIWRAASLLRVNVKGLALALFDASSLEEQREIFAMAEPHIWKPWMRWFLSHPGLMSLVGVPPSQVRLIDSSHPGGLPGYILDKFRHVMTEVPARDNYFWRVYTTGSYTLDCCPGYLRRGNLPVLSRRADAVRTHSISLAGFLRRHPGSYSHFLLLDHQDWLAWHDPRGLREEWELILSNSRPGTRILMRSAGLDCSFIPEDILERLRFLPDLAATLHLRDRVGTYGSLHLAEVR